MHVERGIVGPVRLAWADLDRDEPPPTSALIALGAAQVRRHGELAGLSAARFLTGRWLLARLIADFDDSTDVTISSVCDRCGGPHGPPRVEGAAVAVSVSYAGSVVVSAAVDHALASSVGVDAETEADAATGRLKDLATLFAPNPPPDLRGWTEIEAALKADGRGLRVEPGAVRAGAAVASALPHARAMWIPGRSDPIEVAAASSPSGLVVSVAIATAARSEPSGAPDRRERTMAEVRGVRTRPAMREGAGPRGLP